MAYQVLALKWRPQIFEDLVGQEPVARTLTNAIQQDRIANAFIFSGVRGVGKTTTARILAKALNCASGPTVRPCGSCPACQEIAAGNSLDVLEIDGASNNGVEQVREIIEGARYAPSRDPFKIYIIDEVHMLSTSAFNALLKTLEEPPPSVKFIFATTELHKIPDTILSRCQEFEFRTVASARIGDHLKQIASSEGVTVSERALSQLARAAEGSLRDALSAFDQVIAATGETIEESDVTELLGLIEHDVLLDTVEAIASRDTASVLQIVEQLVSSGRDLKHFATGLMQCFRDVLVVNVAPQAEGLVLYAEDRERLEKLASELSEEDLVRSLDVLTAVESSLRWSPEPRFHLEMALLKLAQLRHLASFEELLRRFEEMASSGSSTGSSSGGGSGESFPSARPRPEPSRKSVGGTDYPRRPQTPSAHAAKAAPPPAPEVSAVGNTGADSDRAEAHRSSLEGSEGSEGPPPPTFEGYDEELSEQQPDAPAPPKQMQAPPAGETHSTSSAGAPQSEAVELAEVLMDALRKKKPMLRAMLSHHHSVVLDGDALVFRFEMTESLIVEQLSAKDNAAVLVSELSQAVGKAMRVTAVTHEERQTTEPKGHAPQTSEAPLRRNGVSEAEPADGEPESDLGAKARKDPLVQQFLSAFKGEVEDVEDPRGPDDSNRG